PRRGADRPAAALRGAGLSGSAASAWRRSNTPKRRFQPVAKTPISPAKVWRVRGGDFMAGGGRPLFGEQTRFMLLLITPAALLLTLFQGVPIAIGAKASFRR